MNSEKILIIEDDPAILFGLRDNFSRAGYEVKTAVEGKLGLELALSWKPALLLLDLMPARSGRLSDLSGTRRSERDLPIIMLTALGQEEQVIKGLNLGADDYVTKPLQHSTTPRSRGCVPQAAAAAIPSVIRLGDVEVNLTARELRRDGNLWK